MTEDRSFDSQEDDARARHHEREADAVFLRDRAAIVAALHVALRPHKWETKADAVDRVAIYLSTVEAKPAFLLSHLMPLADFADWYGFDMLEKAFVLAQTTTPARIDTPLDEDGDTSWS